MMRKLTCLAVLEPSTDGYGVFFPDLPGCISFGKDYRRGSANGKGSFLATYIRNVKREILH